MEPPARITLKSPFTISASSLAFLSSDLMPRFATLPPQQPPLSPGVYIGKIASATGRVSEAGNDLISMRIVFPDGQSLPCCLTFVPQARPVINAFCDSAQLTKPADPDVEVELTAAHCKNRYLYILLSND